MPARKITFLLHYILNGFVGRLGHPNGCRLSPRVGHFCRHHWTSGRLRRAAFTFGNYV